MLVSFFVILPLGPLRASSSHHAGYESVEDDDTLDEQDELDSHPENASLLASSMHSASGRSFTSAKSNGLPSALVGFKANLRRARGLFFP
jgi:battenin